MTTVRRVGNLDMRDPSIRALFERGAGFVRFGPGAGRDAPRDLTRLEGALLAFAFDEGGCYLGSAVDLCGDWRDPETTLAAQAALRRLVHAGLLSTDETGHFQCTTWSSSLAATLVRDDGRSPFPEV